ncbi:MAG TPA: DUF2807 domain-containing protein [Paucimonas sp.]|nr:DUF2807 domain-containing protein [Paucimonas sp.]
MKKILGLALAASALSAGFVAAAHADEAVSETRAVDGRVTRVHLDGVISLKVKQGATPSLVIFADKEQLPRITSTQNADTLVINSQTDSRLRSKLFGTRTDASSIRAELTLPNLRELNARGVGGSHVSGFSGDDLEVALEGSGSIYVTSQFKRVSARLAGVGSINLSTGDTERIELSLPGAGNITASGKAKELAADVGGVGNLDARQLTVDTLRLGLHGVGGATVTVKQAANIDLNGIGSATIYGQPVTRNVTMNGLGKAIWK